MPKPFKCAERKLLFIHVPKTGGCSVRVALESVLPNDQHDFINPESAFLTVTAPIWRFRSKIKSVIAATPPGRALFYKLRPNNGHHPANWYRTWLPAFETYFKFAFLRNPFDRTVSLYTFARLKGLHIDRFAVRDLSFAEFVPLLDGVNVRSQTHYLVDDTGKSLIDFIGAFERLEQDFAALTHKIGIAAALPHRNRSEHAPWRALYTDALLDRVYTVYKADFDLGKSALGIDYRDAA